ncbi:biotin-dependent carboxyltransferase family protein [Puniceibacterium sp. IMCC21224]|uniref:5-oxoprolinase subunit C family protein n=1 Tax=Puniceibacterium sp. IMCC21224 TaxID=1618204 RepID=UPI00064DF16E|nr:urea amidolyase [Puniceibacterium sp. IMCC21224]KMK67758.1 allophanate hydrolase subunit 2 [Puniceibacterium sp. IMCC21224]
MRRVLIVHRAGPGVTIQDGGRPGFLAFGLSRGGATDRLALAEGAALLGQSDDLAVLEMPGMGGRFEVTQDTRFALTGGEMRATLDGAPLVWNASHLLPAGAVLDIGPVTSGAYGYLHLGGGIGTEPAMGARATHLTAGLGRVIEAGQRLPLGVDKGSRAGMLLPRDDRFRGGTLRVVESLQTGFFPADDLKRFTTTTFTRDTRANRMGVRMPSDGPGFHVEGGLNVVSEIIVPGDIQVTGDGTPFVLLSECQTTGGYPRIATVLPADLPRVAQAPPGAKLGFRFVPLAEAVEAEAKFRKHCKDLPRSLQPLVRDPHDISDLLSYQLISGVTAGDDL